jgi:tetratricopeptide (TPR) repeat protein
VPGRKYEVLSDRKDQRSRGDALAYHGIAMTGYQTDAEAARRAAISNDPDDPGGHIALGLELLGLGRHAEAERACREAIRADPDDALGHQGLGVVLWEAKRYAEAEEAFRAAIKLDPSNAWTHHNLGRLLAVDDDRLAEAEAELRVAVSLDPANAEAQQDLDAIGRGTADPDDDFGHDKGPASPAAFQRWRNSLRVARENPPDPAALLAYPPAGAGRRFLSGFMDYVWWLCAIVLSITAGGTGALMGVFAAALFIYSGFIEGRSGQSTGKAITRLYLIQADTGEYIGSKRSLYRMALHVLDTLPLCLGWLLGLATGRTIADRIIGTVVVYRPRGS